MNILNQLKTDRNDAGFLIEQTAWEPKADRASVELLFREPDSNDFKRLQFEKDDSPCWLRIVAQHIKAGRNYQHSFQIDKKQLEALIENLKVLSAKLEY